MELIDLQFGTACHCEQLFLKMKHAKCMLHLQLSNHRLSNVLLLSTYLILIIKGFWIIVLIFIIISTTFWPICPPAFFRCLSNSETYTERQTRITAIMYDFFTCVRIQIFYIIVVIQVK